MLKKTLNGGNELAESKNWKEIHCSNFERRERKGFHIQSINYLSASTECLKVISLSNLEEEKRIRFIEISNLSSFFWLDSDQKKRFFVRVVKKEREKRKNKQNSSDCNWQHSSTPIHLYYDLQDCLIYSIRLLA